ncbi:MAG: TetR/AcrR family transcriptional regulator [Candidatus Izemoplasmatales bacterium]
MKNNDKTRLLLENKALFNATIKEFANNSYTLASTNEIIKNSGINKGSFYYRFANKQEIFVAMMDYIIVKQIDLFNERNISISILTNLKDILFELFKNLHLLYLEDIYYFQIITKQLVDKESATIIKANCIEPLKTRFMNRINAFKNEENYEKIIILIDNLYFNFPTSILISENFDIDLKEFINFLVSKSTKATNKSLTSNTNLKEFELTYSPSYIITDDRNIKLPSDFLCISSLFINFKNTESKIKSMLKLLRLTYKKSVEKIIKRSFKQLDYLLAFNDKEIIKKVEENFCFKKLMYCSLYIAATEVPYVAIDFILDIFSKEEKSLFYQHILPIISKTSKILVLTKEIEIDMKTKNIYYIDSLNHVQELDKTKYESYFYKHLEIKYIENKTFMVNYLNPYQLSNFDVLNKEIIDMRFIKKIDYNTIMINEEKI